jgi:HSP20 family molecular chaperone IbpA
MSDVAIQKKPDETKSIWSLVEDTQQLFNQLQQRAFHCFTQRGGGDGMALEDWLQAEREMLEIPPSELTEDENALHLRAAVPGLKAKDIEVTATPQELVIRGETSERNNGKKGKTRFSEFSEKKMFRRYGLPARVDVDRISADIKDGMLTIDMPKAEPAKKVQVSGVAVDAQPMSFGAAATGSRSRKATDQKR